MKKIYIVLIIIILILIFSFFYYKNEKLGNTIIKLSKEKIVENILNGDFCYESKVKVKIYSNKNENEYNLKIKETLNENTLEVVEKNDISGLRIENKDGDLIIKSNKLKLSKIYEDYHEMMDNSLLLSTFVKECNSSNKNIEENNDEIIIKIILKDYTKYIKYKELYLDKSTGMPTKLIIKDSSNKPKIIIEYTSIKTL